jgi:hypothetical protein
MVSTFFSYDVNVLKWFTYEWYVIESLMNDEMFDWILDDCYNDYEMLIEFLMNVETMMKMLIFWNDLFEEDILLCCDEY